MSRDTHEQLPVARADRGTGALPSAVTFFLSRAQRDAVLERLRMLGEDRGVALLKALGLIETQGTHRDEQSEEH